MHTIKITPNLLFEYQCISGKFIRLPNRIESKVFARIGMLYYSFDQTRHIVYCPRSRLATQWCHKRPG